MAKKWKELCMGIVTGVVLSAAGTYLINKLLKETPKKDNKTEQMIKDMSLQGISVTKSGAENAPDSVLSSVDISYPFWEDSPVYSNPKYRAREPLENPKSIKLGEETQKITLTSQEAKRFIDFKIGHLLKSDSPKGNIQAEIDRLNKAKESLTDGTEVLGIIVSNQNNTHSKTIQNFEYDEYESPFKYQASKEETGPWQVENRATETPSSEGGTTYALHHEDIEIRGLTGGADIVVEFYGNNVEQMLKQIGKHNILEDESFEKIQKAIAKVSRHTEEMSGLLRIKNPDEAQLGAKSSRAPKPKAPKRKSKRDALPGKTLADMKALKEIKDQKRLKA